MCICVSYSEVKGEIQQQLGRTTIIPVLGSGFTRGCTSRKGSVPSGDDYKNYMINQIMQERGYDDSKRPDYEKESFQDISLLYHKIISREEQRRYLRNNFTEVELSSDKKEFLKINWPYVYTLNIDDAIEKNSRYNTVVYSNRKIWDDIFTTSKCTIKLHGHIEDILLYEDSKCEIFDISQYVQSLNDNRVLLDKLRHDYEYLNLMYIGCGLKNEIDLISIASGAVSNGNRYYCTAKQPDEDALVKLSTYGITHCVIFDSYDAIYTELTVSAEEAKKIGKSELDEYKIFEFKELKEGFDENKPYLFHGKSLINRKKREVLLPSFFISRKITDRIIANIKNEGTQILFGSGCSGKTYVTIDLAKRVVDRDVFVFQSRERINKDAFLSLCHRKNCLIIADSKSLSDGQIEEIIRSNIERVERRNSFVIVENKSNHELISLLFLLRLTDIIKKDELIPYELKNRLDTNENNELNKKLVKSSFGIFAERKSISDNIIDTSARLIQRTQFDSIVLGMQTIKEVACLIALATMEKVYSRGVVILSLEEEFILQKKKAFPLIDEEGTWSFEISADKNSPKKYVVNAKFWLYNQLDKLAITKSGREKIIEAYRYIIQKIIEHYGKPDLRRKKSIPYKEYILFDNINRIFASQGNMLIRDIYERLNDLLSTDPNYLHQRAKCYIRSSYITSDSKKKKNWLTQAHRDASSSYEIFEERYIETGNEKVQISSAHALYTIALALCHLAKLENHKDLKMNESAIEYLHLALSSPYNSMEFIRKDKVYNYGNIIGETITTLAANLFLIPSKKTQISIGELIKIRGNFNLIR